MKLLFVTLLTLLSQQSVVAQERSKELLDRLESAVESLGEYRAEFSVEVDGSKYNGYYRVSGRSYYMKLSDAEVYSDGVVRYEIDLQKQEVIIDNVDPTSRNILNNPTNLFSTLDESFMHSILSESRGEVSILLLPNSSSVGISRVTINLDKKSALPRSLIYNADSNPVEITIHSIKSDSEAMPQFDIKNYPQFEIIDFR